MTAVIHIDPQPLLAVLDERGWTKHSYTSDTGVCLHGVVRSAKFQGSVSDRPEPKKVEMKRS